jgi:precorrin-2 dehydrogenase/sirohydrochlorin ferrochelatase
MLIVYRMTKVCVQWSLEDLCEMEPEDMDALLESYAPDKVPTFTKVRTGKDEAEWDFDGSFGWACVC